METRLNIPKNWQDFESICHKLWRDIWCDANARRNGRQGQPQCGVDVYGAAVYRDISAGVQCKDKDGRSGSSLSIKELNTECKKAIRFKPSIDEYTIATTAPRDVAIQEHVRLMNDTDVLPFNVYVWSWDDIEEEILYRPDILRAYYSSFQFPEADQARMTASPISNPDQWRAFYSRPIMRSLMSTTFQGILRMLCYELSDNAYHYGKASKFTISCEQRSICFIDNGAEFNPTTQLDAKKASPSKYVGSQVFSSFLQECGKDVSVSHERGMYKNESCNILTFVNLNRTPSQTPNPDVVPNALLGTR